MIDTQGRSRTALFIERDPEYVLVQRGIRHHCSKLEWKVPLYRQAAIAECWRLADNIRSEGDYLVTPLPVTLYREPMTGEVVCANIQTPQDSGPKWIDAMGVKLLMPNTFGLVVERTTYAQWAEGPLLYVGDCEALAPPDPLKNRSLQYYRHQNSGLREALDAAIEPALDPIARDIGSEEYVDFRVRGMFRRRAPRVLESKQDVGGSEINADDKIILDGQTYAISELMQE